MVLCLGFGTARKKTPWLEPSAELAAPGTPTASMAATQSWSAPASPLRLLWPSSALRPTIPLPFSKLNPSVILRSSFGSLEVTPKFYLGETEG